MCKKLLFIFCLFFLLRPLSATPSFNIDWNKIDNSLNMLEWNLTTAGTTISQLQNQLEEQQKYSANLQVQLETYENKYQRLEKTTRLWKYTSTILFSSTVALLGVTLWQLNNQ